MKISSVLDYNAKSEETSYGGSSSSMQEESLRLGGHPSDDILLDGAPKCWAGARQPYEFRSATR
ncbi:MAG TPA: hypothetical protein VGO27_03560 [Candidatus Acidoferrum sp.]|nr:hypothetical protein [Candidatus Acidoferrum sp.]